MDLQFGVFILQGWKTELSTISDPVEKWSKSIETAQLAESLGYDSLWVYDHLWAIRYPPDRSHDDAPVPAHEAMFECWTTLAAMSQQTTNIKLGQMVGCALYREPALLAKITSNIDVMSGGRLIWGIGAGWYEREFAGYGYRFPSAADRVRMLEETVEIVTAMWSEPEVDYQGRYYELKGAVCDPKPVQSPRPQVLIGGAGEQMTLRVVARLADASNFGGPPEEFSHKAGVLADHCRGVGRDYDEIQKTWSPELFIREDEKEIIDGGSRSYAPAALDSWAASNLVGTPEQVAERIQTYIDLGCTGFYPWCSAYPETESMRLLADLVIPEIRRANA